MDEKEKQMLKDIDAVCDFIKAHKPEQSVFVKNKKRYEEVMNAIEELANIAFASDETAKVFIGNDELVGNDIVMDIECSLLSTVEIDRFLSAIKTAYSIDIVPLTNGNIRITIGFAGAWKIYFPEK